jgi:nanoRNase/pAp phosphatase (c-di-AMP/oligoRNAs hydrolase)
VINTTELISEIGEALYTNLNIAFAVMYHFDKNGDMKVSLRSNKTDVGKVAKYFGGGGHAGAAGLILSADQAPSRLERWRVNLQI